MAREHVLFTPALLVTYGLMDRDPVGQYVQHVRPDLAPVAMDGPPIFQGLGKSNLQDSGLIDWDRRIYAVPKAGWTACRDFLGGLVLFDRRRMHYARMAYYELQVIDTWAFGRGHILPELPYVPVTVFAVSTNRHFIYLEPARDPPRTWPWLVVDFARPETIREAEALLGPPPAPEKIREIIHGTQNPTA